MSSDEPAMVDFVGDCEICGSPAKWRGRPIAPQDGEWRGVFPAWVLSCGPCGYTFPDVGKAVTPPTPSRVESAIGWIAERIAG